MRLPSYPEVRREILHRVRCLQERLLLLLVAVMRAGRGSGGDGASDVSQCLMASDQLLEAIVEERPGAHVARLVLHPDDLLRTRIAFQRFDDHRAREGVE